MIKTGGLKVVIRVGSYDVLLDHVSNSNLVRIRISDGVAIVGEVMETYEDLKRGVDLLT